VNSPTPMAQLRPTGDIHEYTGSPPPSSGYTYANSGEDELEHSSDPETGGLLKKSHHPRDWRAWRQDRGAEAIRRICGGMVGVVFTVMVLL